MAAKADYSTEANRLISNHASSVASWETKETDSMHSLFFLLLIENRENSRHEKDLRSHGSSKKQGLTLISLALSIFPHHMLLDLGPLGSNLNLAKLHELLVLCRCTDRQAILHCSPHTAEILLPQKLCNRRKNNASCERVGSD